MPENTKSTSAITPSEKAVQFINSEVLDPPAQGDISFVKPYAEQVVVMALEDARSFLQGTEQILLVFIARALEELLSGGAPAAVDREEIAPGSRPSEPDDGQSARPKSSGNAPQDTTRALAAAEALLAILPKFHASMAETAHKFKGDS